MDMLSNGSTLSDLPDGVYTVPQLELVSILSPLICVALLFFRFVV